MEQWIEEFLYRGRPPSGSDSDKTPAFHVVIGSQAESPLDPAEKVRKFSSPMSLEAAEQAGWTFEAIVAGMNTEAIKQCAAHEVKIAELESELEKSKQALVVAETDAISAQQENDVLNMKIAELSKPAE